MAETEICFLTACELARRIRARELSCVEVMQAHLAQIGRINPLVNAIVTLLPEQAMAVSITARFVAIDRVLPAYRTDDRPPRYH